tara:strand:+ start:6802 stop:7284 length:483 start_codon:yes stop_codon:yes gene_type:complete
MRIVNTDLGVAAVVIQNSKILLVQEAQGPHVGRWGLPKGHVESGELPAMAALRELREECGLNGTVTGICGIRECLRDGLARLFIAYRIHTNERSLIVNVDEISNAQYISSGELDGLNWISPAMHALAKSGLDDVYSMSMIDFSSSQSYPYLVHVGQEALS